MIQHVTGAKLSSKHLYMPLGLALSSTLFGLIVYGIFECLISSWILRNSCPGYCITRRTRNYLLLLCGPSGTSRIKFTSLNWVVVLTTLPSLSRIDLRSFFWSSFPNNLNHRNLVSHGNHHHQIFSKSILMELYFQVRISLVLGLSFAILMV